MPGPPPPSQSYLLKIVDSSDEEDEDDEVLEEEILQYDESTAVTMDESLSASVAEVVDVSTTPSPTGSKRKRKKKKKKKKKGGAGKQQQQADATSSSPTQDVTMPDAPKKTVAFGTVSVHSFERVLGTDVVPYDGGWPLGLGTTEIGEVESTEVEAYETAKQERLRIRAKELGVVEEESSHDDDAEVVLETRQWDYKYKSKNPLFHLLQEERRMNLLLQSSTPEDELDGSKSAMNSSCSSSSSPSSSSKRRDSKGTPDSKSKKRRDSKNKHNNNNGSNGKHNSHGNINGNSNNNHHPMATRNSSHSKRERSGSFSSTTERYNDTFTQVKVHHVRNELEELRFQRSGEGHTGCTCRKLDVYLLPPNAGKKAHHRRMNVKRVKDELKKRHLLPSRQQTREELELLLHDAVEKEACCSSHDCPCVRNGIECQADVCACWHDSHQAKDNHSHNTNGRCTLPVETIQARCGNANGMYAVDLQAIQSFREALLAKVVVKKNNSEAGDGNDEAHVDCFICPPVSVHTPIPPQQREQA